MVLPIVNAVIINGILSRKRKSNKMPSKGCLCSDETKRKISDARNAIRENVIFRKKSLNLYLVLLILSINNTLIIKNTAASGRIVRSIPFPVPVNVLTVPTV